MRSTSRSGSVVKSGRSSSKLSFVYSHQKNRSSESENEWSNEPLTPQNDASPSMRSCVAHSWPTFPPSPNAVRPFASECDQLTVSSAMSRVRTRSGPRG